MLEKQLNLKKENMKKKNKTTKSDTMRKEYDFSNGIRGKYSKRYWQSNNLVALSKDVAKYFADSESVNEALRTLLRISGKKSSKVA